MKQLFMAFSMCLILGSCDPDDIFGSTGTADFYIKNNLCDTSFLIFTEYNHYHDTCIIPTDSIICFFSDLRGIKGENSYSEEELSTRLFDIYITNTVTSVKLKNTQDSVLMEWVPDSTYKKSFYDITNWTWVCTDSKLDRYKWTFTINPEDLE